MAEDEWITGNIGVKICGVPMEFELTVPAKPVKPQRMLPIFHQMANSFVDVGVEVVQSEGKHISCKAGCGACCRQAVPIAETEIYDIAELVESMPEPRRTEVKQRFVAATEHFHKIGWYERFLGYQKNAAGKESDELRHKLADMLLEYFHQAIPCPFLENESCSIHQNRPVACREYLVTTPAKNCADPSPQVSIVDLLIKPSLGLRKLGSKGRLEGLGLPILTRALEIAGDYPEEFEQKSGPDWMKDFFNELNRAVSGDPSKIG